MARAPLTPTEVFNRHVVYTRNTGHEPIPKMHYLDEPIIVPNAETLMDGDRSGNQITKLPEYYDVIAAQAELKNLQGQAIRDGRSAELVIN